MKCLHFITTLLCVVCCALSFVACDDNNETTPELVLAFKDSTVIAQADGEQLYVHYTFTGDVSTLNATIDDTWAHSIDLSNEGYVGFIVDKNPEEVGRTTYLRLNADGFEEASLKIVQIKGEPAEFSITITEVGADTATYAVIPNDPNRPYISMVIPKQSADSFIDDDDFFLADLMYFQALAEGYDVTMEDVIRSIALTDAQSMTWNGLSQNTEYCAYAYGITVAGQRTTDIVKEYFKTEPIVSNNQLTLDVENITTIEFDLVIGASNDTDGYIWEVQESSWYDGLTDEQVVEQIKMNYGEYVDMIVEYGSNTIHIGPTLIEPDTEYTAVLFGYQAGGMTTPMIRKTFRTEKGIDPADLRFTFDVKNIDKYSADVTVMPSSESVYYYWDVVDAEYTAEDFKALMDQYVEEFVAAGVVASPQEFWMDATSRGMDATIIGQLNSNTEYKPVAVAININEAKFAGDVYFGTPFCTKEAVVSDAKISVIHNEYFDGDELIARYASQGLYTSYAGLAYVPFHVVLENNPAHYHYAIFYYEDGLDNPSEWSDESLMHILMQDCLTDIDMWYPGLEWDIDYILLAIAEDSNGDFGPLYRERMSFTKSGVTDINRFEEIVKSPKSAGLAAKRAERELSTIRIKTNAIDFNKSAATTPSKWQSRLSIK